MKEILHVSLGTGFLKGDENGQVKDGLLFWGKNLSLVTIDGQNRVTHENMKRLCNTSHNQQRYFRFAPNFGDVDTYAKRNGLDIPKVPKEIKMDAVDANSVAIYNAAAQMVMHEQKDEFEKIIQLIKSHIRCSRHQ